MKLFLKSRRSDYNATCEYDNGLFTVCKDSKLCTIHSKFNLSKQVLDARNNKELVDENLMTKKDVVFNSASTSAQFVVAQSVNGNRAWKNEDGKSLKDIIKER